MSAVITATDATLADNTVSDGYIGPFIRVKYTTTGTYAGTTTIRIDAQAKTMTQNHKVITQP